MAEVPINDNDIDDSAAMAAAMGFSGFGMQPAAKKRKFNPNADATVAGLPKKPSATSKTRSTGANSAPLGQRRLPVPPTSLPSRPPVSAVPPPRMGNADEIDLDDDEDEADGNGVALGGGPTNGSHANPAPLGEQHPHMDIAAHQRVQYEARNQHSHRGRGNQQTDGKPWWEDYVDVRMNENPWARLEQQRGLEARGVWPSSSTTGSNSRPNAGLPTTAKVAEGGVPAAGTTEADRQEEFSDPGAEDEP